VTVDGTLRPGRGNRADLAAKRLLDILGAAILLLPLAPLATVAALLLQAGGRGPVFFRQEREGRHGRPFLILKLRTMHVDADARLRRHLAADPAAAAAFARSGCLAHDPRIVRPAGAWVRKYSIDEIPQLWNVLVGEMSLVGPRPLPPAEAAGLFDAPTRRARLTVRPGMSGLWQVSRGSKSIRLDAAALDLRYVQSRSLRLDLEILLRTPAAVLSGRGLV
jgi:lipopolysaccharide/colanic/teichoic acid biosynthesis glycosyltransferase